MRIGLLLGFLFVCNLAFSQTRLFLSVGTNWDTEFSATPNLNFGLPANAIFLGSVTHDTRIGKYLRADLTMEKRVYGPYYWLTGLKFNQSGYKYYNPPFTSDLKNSYLSIPLLFRLNFYNANVLFIDFGLMENFLLNSHLKESFLDHKAEKNITGNISRLSTSFYFEFMYYFRLVGIGMFSQARAFASSKDFSADWNIESNRSVYLLYADNYSFRSTGFKLTCRIK